MTGLFFDTETTGIKRWDNQGFIPQLVQLGAILQDLDTGRVLAELNLINRQCGAIPEEASNVHGISQELAESYGIDRVTIDELLVQLAEHADLVVAHNIDYDLDIVKDNLPLTRPVMENRQQFCTMRGSIYIVKAPHSEKQKKYFTYHPEAMDAPYKVPSLTQTFEHFYGKPFEGAHDAMADIRACRDVFQTLLSEGYYVIDGGEVVPTAKVLAEAAS